MNKLEIINQIKTKKIAIAEIMDKISDEKRELRNVEKITLESLKSEVTELETRLSATPEVELRKVEQPQEQFSFLATIRDYVEGRGMSDSTRNVMEATKRSFEGSGISLKGQFVLPIFEARTQTNYNAGTATEGKELIGSQLLEPLTALKANLVLNQAGATLVTGLKNELVIPKMAANSVGWALETADAGNAVGATSSLSMLPKRLTAYVDVSKLLLQQASADVENLLINEINSAVANKLEESILSTFSGTTTQPAGIFSGLAATTGATTYVNMVALESTLETNNAAKGKLAYLVHPTVKGAAKTTAAFTNGSIPIMNGTEINGYQTLTTSVLPAGANSTRVTAFANWSDLVIGVWGNGAEISVDPYSQAIGGKIRIVINFYVNWVMTRTESISAKYLK